MSWWYNKNLKIEFRAVPYAVNNHVLEFRISPDQDLTFETDESFLGFKYKKKRQYKTDWHRAQKFLNYPGACHRDEEDCYLPIFIYNQRELEFYKNNFSTFDDFFKWIEKEDNKEKKEWEIERNNWLANNEAWY